MSTEILAARAPSDNPDDYSLSQSSEGGYSYELSDGTTVFAADKEEVFQNCPFFSEMFADNPLLAETMFEATIEGNKMLEAKAKAFGDEDMSDTSKDEEIDGDTGKSRAGENDWNWFSSKDELLEAVENGEIDEEMLAEIEDDYVFEEPVVSKQEAYEDDTDLADHPSQLFVEDSAEAVVEEQIVASKNIDDFQEESPILYQDAPVKHEPEPLAYEPNVQEVQPSTTVESQENRNFHDLAMPAPDLEPLLRAEKSYNAATFFPDTAHLTQNTTNNEMPKLAPEPKDKIHAVNEDVAPVVDVAPNPKVSFTTQTFKSYISPSEEKPSWVDNKPETDNQTGNEQKKSETLQENVGINEENPRPKKKSKKGKAAPTVPKVELEQTEHSAGGGEKAGFIRSYDKFIESGRLKPKSESKSSLSELDQDVPQKLKKGNLDDLRQDVDLPIEQTFAGLFDVIVENPEFEEKAALALLLADIDDDFKDPNEEVSGTLPSRREKVHTLFKFLGYKDPEPMLEEFVREHGEDMLVDVLKNLSSHLSEQEDEDAQVSTNVEMIWAGALSEDNEASKDETITRAYIELLLLSFDEESTDKKDEEAQTNRFYSEIKLAKHFFEGGDGVSENPDKTGLAELHDAEMSTNFGAEGEETETDSFEARVVDVIKNEEPVTLDQLKESVDGSDLEEVLVDLAASFLTDKLEVNQKEEFIALTGDLSEALDQGKKEDADGQEILKLTPEVVQKAYVLLEFLGYEEPKEVLIKFAKENSTASLLKLLKEIAEISELKKKKSFEKILWSISERDKTSRPSFEIVIPGFPLTPVFLTAA